MRVSTACQACRFRRRKCDAPKFGVSCTYCATRRINCTRDSSSISQDVPAINKRSPSESSPTPLLPKVQPISATEEQSPNEFRSGDIPPDNVLLDILPPLQICLELVHLYFDFIHDQFHSLFHEPSLIEDLSNGRASPVIILAMMALSARFSTNPIFSNIDPRVRGDRYAEESSRLLDLRDVSLTTAQGCVLLGAFSITCGEAHAESVYYSVACRIGNLLDLANRPTLNAIEREVNIRGRSGHIPAILLKRSLTEEVWWSLCMVDVWSSTGVRLPRMMPVLENVPLPIDEAVFIPLDGTEVLSATFNYDFSSASSLLAQMIKLNRILLEINSLNQQTVSGATSGVKLEYEVMSLASALEEWHQSLPLFMHDTRTNLERYATQGLGRMFVAVYLGYYHFGQLLFYQFLHSSSHSQLPNASFHADKCKSYAEALCEIIYASHTIANCDVQYTMVGHILVIASTVQIHTLLFSPSATQISAARRRLERNFEILSQLRDIWPTLDICFTRLRAFHKACRKEMDESFRLDQWMLRFLFEFAERVDDRVADPIDEVWSLENIGFSPGTEF